MYHGTAVPQGGPTIELSLDMCQATMLLTLLAEAQQRRQVSDFAGDYEVMEKLSTGIGEKLEAAGMSPLGPTD